MYDLLTVLSRHPLHPPPSDKLRWERIPQTKRFLKSQPPAGTPSLLIPSEAGWGA
ncbi:uncharacterized protein SCHCODRAFT_02619303 [Schizophyllum commune H4-8]|uniref:uncharacterized protein n=1 Tax=Schizophyllum commune (strain H4-8 / FGSC 9210) TaxID=578458 RepID=UPI00215E696F|nr:uncharacterized protein SCHCODRAFT_02619293 [Schizophyllum commune H4-8]XP_050201199.1 uncharacterized protein SCHCODRAFT_02619303 [Schizophyllum commune H4-8]KAI5895392.1 hypothetical protein SCHCODRAFT_02619293 [Schizophyllum commune H4-8]KAI5895396.1 hypothetical protein SCHCODRAFT_02619303 [Schizophyllum commune H4-8]